MGLSGIGSFNAIDLQKKLAGKAAGARGSISETGESVSGGGSPKDIETMFQLAYLSFTAPRLDMEAYKAFQNQVGPFLANRGSDPGSVFGDTIQVTMSQHSFRSRPITAATFAEVNPEKALAFYKDRFADASDFTFVIVGNVDTTRIKPMVEQYLASLPSLNRKETYKDNGGTPPRGVIERIVHKGVEPKADTRIIFSGTCEYKPETRFELRTLTELFQIKLDETLREQLGGVYSPSVGGSCSRAPAQRYSIHVSFNSSPENLDKLSKTVMAMIDTLKTTPPSAADVNKVKEALIREREVSLKQNSFWLGNIIAREQAGEDITGLTDAYDAMIKNLTPASISAAARKYFDVNNYARFVLLPESKTTP
jgi:zinc protease